MNVELVDVMGNDLSVVNAARVSYAKSSHLLCDQDIKLIRYLLKHSHWSPFAHPQASFRIQAPLFVARQLWKHNIGSSGGDAGHPAWNETSRRYVDHDAELYTRPMWRRRAENVKQGSSNETIQLSEELQQHLNQYNVEALELYGILLEEGVAPEQARMVLPQSMMTEWIWTGSLLFWLRLIQLRTTSDAQSETKDIAQQIQSYLIPYFPTVMEAWADIYGTEHATNKNEEE